MNFFITPKLLLLLLAYMVLLQLNSAKLEHAPITDYIFINPYSHQHHLDKYTQPKSDHGRTGHGKAQKTKQAIIDSLSNKEGNNSPKKRIELLPFPISQIHKTVGKYLKPIKDKIMSKLSSPKRDTDLDDNDNDAIKSIVETEMKKLEKNILKAAAMMAAKEKTNKSHRTTKRPKQPFKTLKDDIMINLIESGLEDNDENSNTTVMVEKREEQDGVVHRIGDTKGRPRIYHA